MLLYQEIQCLFNSHEWGDSAERWCYSSRKTLRFIQYSFKEQTEFTILIKLLDHLVLYIKDSLTKTAVFLPFTYKWWYCTKLMSLTHENTDRQHSMQKLTQFTMLNKVQGPLAWNINASLTRPVVLLPFTWTGWCSRKLMLLILENTERNAVLL
jgi:hypothetical protein